MSIPAYSNYRESDIQWLGQVPSHWTVKRLKYLLQETDQRGGETSHELLGLSKSRGVIRRSELSQGASASDDYGKYKLVRPNQLVMNKMQAWNGVFGLAPIGGVISPDYAVFDVIDATYSRFLCALLRTEQVAGELFTRCRGMGTAFLRLNTGDFFEVKVALPPPTEVSAITAFLDRETAKIDRLVDEQRSLIALLEEKRQAVISNAVTKGLNPDAPMKESGIGWLGEIPAHWEVGPLKRYWSVTDCKHVTADFVDEGIPLASIREVQSYFVDLSAAKQTSPAFFEQLTGGGRMPADGDLIFSRNATVGEVAQVAAWHPPFALGQDVCLLKRRNQDYSPDFVQQTLRSSICVRQIANLLIGSTFKRINVEEIRNLVIPFPPTDEQKQIGSSLVRRLGVLDELMNESQMAIALLQERRASLISAAVTGKIDVRRLTNVIAFPSYRLRLRGLVAAEVIERSGTQKTFGRVKLQKLTFLAEQHVGIHELAGIYIREAAGPLDRQLVADMEVEAGRIAGISVSQPDGARTTVCYRMGSKTGAHSDELSRAIGCERYAALKKLIAVFDGLSTFASEAVATLYAVWNDALIDGKHPTDDELIDSFLNDWHPEKAAKFKAAELPIWLDWMRRHHIVPQGNGSKTSTGRLFA